ncbi:MAG: hypothetical protein KatS3mg082_2942 [Nitrospiraceae bacterium]|nr:MAG: hypothetical protein KatS3mg081_2467 [Gemmatimonadales bacterium]GIW56538.1 MAG: hypothetical protein KatS3mg082_2942 [Nitrospiraceae bacterium]
MAYSYAELTAFSRDQLTKELDQIAVHTQVGLSFLREELWLRGMQEQNARIERMSNHIRVMTVVITIFTVINVAAVLCG